MPDPENYDNPVIPESLHHFFPLETTISPTDFLTDKNFLESDGDKEAKDCSISNNNSMSMWDWM